MERTIELETDIHELWAALTQPQRLSEWFGATAVEVDLRPGGRITFERAGSRWRGLVEAVEPPRRFAFRWLLRDDQVAERTRVEFVLDPTGNGTRLTVSETPLWRDSAPASATAGALV